MLSIGVTYADVTLYGTFDQAYRTDQASKAGDTTKSTSLNGALNGGSSLGFKGSEDLGNGIKVNFLTEFGLGIDQQYSSTSPITNRQSYLGLSGDWGSVEAGRLYSSIFLASAGIDPNGAPAMNGQQVLGNIVTAPQPGTASAAGSDVRTSNLIRYSSPSLGGVNFVVGKSLGEGTGPSNDGTELGVSWTGNGLYVGYNQETWSNSGLVDFISGTTLANAGERKNNLLTASYDFGVAKVSAATGKAEVGTANTQSTFFGISIPVGQASLVASTGSGTRTTSTTDTTKVNTSGLMIGANYTLSKRTMVYFRNGTDTDKTTVQTKNQTTAIGLLHSF